MSKKDKKYYHNKGQEDRKNGKEYNSPSSFLDWFNPSSSAVSESDENSRAYRKGWDNQKKDSK